MCWYLICFFKFYTISIFWVYYTIVYKSSLEHILLRFKYCVKIGWHIGFTHQFLRIWLMMIVLHIWHIGVALVMIILRIWLLSNIFSIYFLLDGVHLKAKRMNFFIKLVIMIFIMSASLPQNFIMKFNLDMSEIIF